MSNIKKKKNGTWGVIASGQATGISTVNPNLLQDGEKVNSVDTILERHLAWLAKLLRNIAWLALHGGGGYGGGSGSGSVSEAETLITISGSDGSPILTGGAVVMDNNGIKIILNGLKATVTKNWTITVNMGNILIAQGNASYFNPILAISSSKIVPYLVNHIGSISINASYEDETNGVYGSANWIGSITESSITLNTVTASFDLETLKDGQYVFEYSVGITGNYTLDILVTKNGAPINSILKTLNIGNTSTNRLVMDVEELLGEDASNASGVYLISSTLTNVAIPSITKSANSTITIVTNDILISTTKLSTDPSTPTEVNLAGSANIVWTAYLSNTTTFKYRYYISDILVKEDTIGSFGIEINDYVSVINKDWAILDLTTSLRIHVEAGSKSGDFTYYIKFIKSNDTYLSVTDEASSHLISNFLARNYDSGTLNHTLKNEGYITGSTLYDITSKLTILNVNNISAILLDAEGTPYLRLSNGAYATIGSWKYGTNSEKTLPRMLNYNTEDGSVNSDGITISICFKADYHPDDFRTILYTGSVDASTGLISTGFSIDAHDVYVNGDSVAKLVDNLITCVDIECIKTTVTTSLGDEVGYIVKVFVDGVLTAVRRLANFPILSDVIYLGSRVHYEGLKVVSDYLCDCNIYNILVYDGILSDYDIMINNINNKVSTTYKNNVTDFSVIDAELRKNFCSRDELGNVISYLYKNGGYDINFLISNGTLNQLALQDYAAALGIPILLLDVHEDSNWTFNNFVALLSTDANNMTLSGTSGKSGAYWDPNGSNTSVVNFKGILNIELQGTSTLADAVKNLNITFEGNADGTTNIFTPKSTWIPELTYTLKADVVDSSHSMNASIGNFINTELGAKGNPYFPFDKEAVENVYGDAALYVKNQLPTATLKHTVEGFPVLLIMRFHTDKEGDVSITPLGIYSFNLGRNAYRNLGFMQVKSIEAGNTTDAPNSYNNDLQIASFPFFKDNVTVKEKERVTANWIEISNTTTLDDVKDASGNVIKRGLTNYTTSLKSLEGFDSSQGDFWQNDDNILNTRYEVRYPSGKLVSDYNNFKTFVRNVMRLPIETTSETLVDGTINRSDCSDSYSLYTFNTSTANYEKTGEIMNMETDSNNFTSGQLGFNEEGAYKYFSIGLYFGLVDNFGKNSTYRSWNNGAYNLDFYDLDTAGGGNNQSALDVSAALWIKMLYNKIADGKNYGYLNETYNLNLSIAGSTVSALHNKLWMSLDTNLFRLVHQLAIGNGEYAKSNYTYYWYDLRKKFLDIAFSIKDAQGNQKYTNFVDYFMDEYFIPLTGNCGSLLFNYDYKLKYLLLFTDDTYKNTKDITKLHGRKIAYTRDWLKKHQLFMDSLMYWRDGSLTLTFNNNVNSRSASTVYTTQESFPIMTNTPLIIYNTFGDLTKTFYFMPLNQEVFVNAGGNGNNPITWNMSNSPNIIRLGNSNAPLSSLNISTLSYAASGNSLDTEGLAALTELNMLNNTKFDSNFNLGAFELGLLSELRVLNFRSTSGSGSFALNLNTTLSSGITTTRYQKLTEIDISESTCISDLILPEVPLLKLSLYKSVITQLNLKGLKYLPEVSLDGCSALTSINISECDKYQLFNINSLVNVNTITLSNNDEMKSVSILNCPNLKSVNIEACPSLTSITINNCNSLSLVTLISCTGLTVLKLNNNGALKTFKIDNCNQANITTLYLHNTQVTTISGNSASQELLDLSAFTSLNEFTIYGNASISDILFANERTPIVISYPFYRCSNLTRIYGNIKLYNAHAASDGIYGIFRGCSKFSIHGIDASVWKGKAIKVGGVVLTAWNLITGREDGNYDSVTLEDAYVSGNKVTNICFQSNDPRALIRLGEGTSMTLFDVYYLFTMFALSNMSVNCGMDRTFTGLSSALFNWNTGNQFNRYTFYRCLRITSISIGFTTGLTYLYSPEEGRDNGLFSPLINLTGLSNFSTSTIVFSKKLFKRASGNYPITSLSWQTVGLIVDDDSVCTSYSDYNNPTFLSTKVDLIGNLDGFFDNMPSISGISATFTGMRYINYDKLVLPKTITSLYTTFLSTYAKGKIDLTKVFPLGSACTAIVNSFRVSDALSILGVSYKAEMPIKDNTFSHLKNMQYLGYDPRGGSSYGSITETSFLGNGLRKYIDLDTFPEGLVLGLSNLNTFAGFFRNLESKTFTSKPKIPGEMFTSNTKLENVAALMMDCNMPFELSGNGFRNCPKLNNVAYFCYHTLSSSTRSPLTGEIPYKLFYHGLLGTTHTTGVTIYGKNGEEPSEDTTPDTINIKYNTYNRNISNMNRCFYGCVGLKYYLNEANLSLEDLIENNPNYDPFDWIYNTTSKTWRRAVNKKSKIGYWGYTGVYTDKSSDSNVEYLDDSTSNIGISSPKTEVLYYMCSPDIFRYCKSNANIVGVFEDCGLNYSVENAGNINNSENYYSTGITGRIVPYLLKNVPDTTSIALLFKNCKCLNSCWYLGTSGYIQLIPLDFFTYNTKISDLREAFQGLSFAANTNLAVFSPLGSNSLDIRKIFCCALYQGVNNTTAWALSGIFANNIISKVSAAFSIKDVNLNDSTALGVSYVDYRTVSLANISISSTNFNKNKFNAISNNIGYVYYGWGRNAANDSVIKDLDRDNNNFG